MAWHGLPCLCMIDPVTGPQHALYPCCNESVCTCRAWLTDSKTGARGCSCNHTHTHQQGIVPECSSLNNPWTCRPLASCSRFVQQWTSMQPSSLAAGDLLNMHALGEEGELTFWRPQPPVGYAILGDCAIAGTSQPTFQVPRQQPMHGGIVSRGHAGARSPTSCGI